MTWTAASICSSLFVLLASLNSLSCLLWDESQSESSQNLGKDGTDEIHRVENKVQFLKSKGSQLSLIFTSHSILSICRDAAPASGSCSLSAPPRPPRPSWWSPAIGTLGRCQATFGTDLPCSWSSFHTKPEACYPGKTPGDQRKKKLLSLCDS